MVSRVTPKTQAQRRERALSALLDFAQDAADSGDDRDALQLDNVRRLLQAAWAPVDWQGLRAGDGETSAAAPKAGRRRSRQTPDVMFGKPH